MLPVILHTLRNSFVHNYCDLFIRFNNYYYYYVHQPNIVVVKLVCYI